MKLREPRIGLLVLMTAALLSLTGASRPVNPLVPRNPQPGVAPADCDQSLAPAPAPRVAVEEIPAPVIAPAAATAPPSGSLRAALHETQAALARNDRAAFDENLRTARSLLATYPTGAERRTGEELVRVYDAAARLWDAQYQSPFFDQSSPEYAIVSGYPGYADAVRRSTLTDPSGQRFYPAAESRDFLGRVAADRLRGIGIQAPTRVAERTPGTSSSRSRTSTPVTPSPTTSTRSIPRRTTTATTGTVRPPRPRRSAPAIASRSHATSTTSEPKTPAPVTSAPGSSPNPSAPPTTAAAPEPAAPVAGTTEPPPATASPAAGETPAVPVPTTATTETTVATDTTPTSPIPAAPSTTSRTRSVVLPTILILIGLVVLIVLFRASK